ncbi:MAG: YibE/F family protein, partial [Endomicrobiales bacterium]
GVKGIGSLIGLSISLAVILLYIVPQILSGQSPLFVSVLGSVVILLLTTYLAHGISKQTTVALVSTLAALLLTVIIADFSVHFTNLSGLNDETSLLIFGPTSTINLQGLLLAGVIIGTLGALNDITTSQAATIIELAKTDRNQKFSHLFYKGLKIGREHIVSMVNTLVLAYAGSSLILFIFIVLNPSHVPYWVFINNELISDEIIRTLAGSTGLLLVVPIVTAIAAAVCDKDKVFSNLITNTKWNIKNQKDQDQFH